MIKSEKNLLEIYMLGFEDELSSEETKIVEKQIEQKGYNLGRLDVLVCDDVRGLDYQTEKVIL